MKRPGEQLMPTIKRIAEFVVTLYMNNNSCIWHSESIIPNLFFCCKMVHPTKGCLVCLLLGSLSNTCGVLWRIAGHIHKYMQMIQPCVPRQFFLLRAPGFLMWGYWRTQRGSQRLCKGSTHNFQCLAVTWLLLHMYSGVLRDAFHAWSTYSLHLEFVLFKSKAA